MLASRAARSAPMRVLSIFHSAAFERTNCKARAASSSAFLHRRNHLIAHAVMHEAIVDCNDRDAFIEKRLGFGPFIAIAPAAAKDMKLRDSS